MTPSKIFAATLCAGAALILGYRIIMWLACRVIDVIDELTK